MVQNDLIQNIQEGNKKDAFLKLFNQYQHLVYNICYRMTGNRENASDVSQEVFIKIYRSIHKFRGDSKLSSWIYRITVNTCLNWERRRKLTNWLSLDFLLESEAKFEPLSEEKTPDQLLEQSETEQIIQRSIQTLPHRQKTAIVLHRYENLSYEEIANVLGISLSAVESLLFRAKKNLAKKLSSLKNNIK